MKIKGGNKIMQFDLIIKNGTIVTAFDTFCGDIGIKGEKISVIAQSISADGAKVIDASGKYVIPGGIDTHTHMEFPFMSATSADDFYSGTVSAACGGITTIIDFAMQGMGETLMQAVKSWQTKADPKVIIDYAIHMIVKELNNNILSELKEIINYGIPSFKLFMTYRKEGLLLDDGSIFKVMKEVQKHGGLIGFHCENNDLIEQLMSQYLSEGKTAPKYFCLSKPSEVEGEAISRAIFIARLAGAKIYVVHMSTKYGCELVRNVRQEGLAVFAETCPHYLFFTDEVYDRKDAANFVMSPPIKEEKDKEALWKGLADGTIQIVGSDHCAFTSEQKRFGQDDFSKIPNGVAGTEVIVPLLFSEGVLKNKITLNQWVQITSYNPAKLFGLYPRKGTLAVGSDADIVIFDPDKKMLLNKENLHSKQGHSIYEGHTGIGWPLATIVRGRIVQENGKICIDKGYGKFIPRQIHSGSTVKELLAASTV